MTTNHAPTISQQPLSQSVQAPNTVTLVVRDTSGNSSLGYQWRTYVNNVPVAIAGATDDQYTTPPASTSDNGNSFDCVVSNDYGSVTTNRVVMIVVSASGAPAPSPAPGPAPSPSPSPSPSPAPSPSPTPAPSPTPSPSPAPAPVTAPTINTQPAAQSVTAPATATFTVAASGTSLAFQWTKNGTAISGATSASYTTPATTTADSGATFGCVVSNSAGAVTSASAPLTVAAAPADTRPGWFAGPSTAATVNTATLIAGRTALTGSTNGGTTGSATVTTTGSDYAWFAVPSATVPTFTSGGFSGGFAASGSVAVSGTTWYLYRSSYPGTYTSTAITLS